MFTTLGSNTHHGFFCFYTTASRIANLETAKKEAANRPKPLQFLFVILLLVPTVFLFPGIKQARIPESALQIHSRKLERGWLGKCLWRDSGCV